MGLGKFRSVAEATRVAKIFKAEPPRIYGNGFHYRQRRTIMKKEKLTWKKFWSDLDRHSVWGLIGILIVSVFFLYVLASLIAVAGVLLIGVPPLGLILLAILIPIALVYAAVPFIYIAKIISRFIKKPSVKKRRTLQRYSRFNENNGR
jgi:hypothetical protein